MTEPLYDPESLARRLDDLAHKMNETRTDPDPLIDMASRLANAPHPQMPPEAAARIRARMMEAQDKQKRLRRFRPSFDWVAAASIFILVLGFGLAALSRSSAPGDTLYPVKEIIEWGEITAAGSARARVFTHLLHAERRADEARTLSKRGEFSLDLFTASLSEIEAAVHIAQDDVSLSSDTLQEMQSKASQITNDLNNILSEAELSALSHESTLSPLKTNVWAMQDGVNALFSTPTYTPTLTSTPTMTATQPAFATASTVLSPPAPTPEGQADEGDPEWDEDADCDNPPPTWAPAEGWRARCEGAPLPQDEATDVGTQP